MGLPGQDLGFEPHPTDAVLPSQLPTQCGRNWSLLWEPSLLCDFGQLTWLLCASASHMLIKEGGLAGLNGLLQF